MAGWVRIVVDCPGCVNRRRLALTHERMPRTPLRRAGIACICPYPARVRGRARRHCARRSRRARRRRPARAHDARPCAARALSGGAGARPDGPQRRADGPLAPARRPDLGWQAAPGALAYAARARSSQGNGARVWHRDRRHPAFASHSLPRSVPQARYRRGPDCHHRKFGPRGGCRGSARRLDALHYPQSDCGRPAHFGRSDSRRRLDVDHQHGLCATADARRQAAPRARG